MPVPRPRKKAYYDERLGDYVIEDVGRIMYPDELEAYKALAREYLGRPVALPGSPFVKRPKRAPGRGHQGALEEVREEEVGEE